MRAPVNAPTSMVADHTWQWIFGSIHFAVAGVVVLYALTGPARKRDWFEFAFRALVLLGGTLGAFVFEGAIDRGGQLWYAERGQWHLVHWFGVYVPLWVAPVYTWFLGGGALWIISYIRKGATPRDFMKLFGGIVVADLLLEVPIIKIAGLYRYWGHQPFYQHDWFPLPAWFLTTNRLFDLVPAMAILGLMSLGRRWMIVLIPLVMPAAIYGAYALVTWPVIGALQNHLSTPVTWAAGTLTIVLGLAGTWTGVHIAPRLRHVMDPYASGPVERAAPDGEDRVGDGVLVAQRGDVVEA